MSHAWLVTVPNRKESPNITFSTVAGSLEDKGQCQLYRFEIPELVVGTLDSLLALSDDLNKVGTQIENVVRKVERQYVEIAAEKATPLRINDKAIEAAFAKFQWDFSQYQCQGKPLSELVSQVQAVAGKTEEELKSIATAYTEKNQALAAAKRRKVINLSTSDFEDFLAPEKIAEVDVYNSETLLTVAVVVPRSLENEFLNTYATLGENIAVINNPDWTDSTAIGQADERFGEAFAKKRASKKGSPVVPKSVSKKPLAEEAESVMYAITILRGHYQAGGFVDDVFTPGVFIDYLDQVKAAFREKRFLVRELSYDSSRYGGIDAAIETGKEDLKQSKQTAVRWCKAHFGEVYTAWLHLKVIQAFVESVLRYGLPVDFVAFFAQPEPRAEKELKAQLTRTVLNLRPELRPKRVAGEDEEEEAEAVDSSPFVFLRLPMIGVTPAVGST